MPDVTCTSCGAENPAGQKFCGECGHALAAVCSSCGAANPPGQRFCGECGTALGATAASPTREPASTAAERRLVSVLFADLVGFTTASEGRDSEETRELLSRYFDTARTLVERYGGTVEKFIGDAVMAVWGTPVAQEDDAERAVRAALDLVAAVPASRRIAARPGGRPDGRGCRHARRRGPGHGRGRPGQHRVAHPVGGRAGQSARGRDHEARLRGGRRLRGRRRARSQGQGRGRPSLARAPCRRQSWRRRSGKRPRGAVRRARPRVPARQGHLPRLGGRRPCHARDSRRGRWDRQVAARVGARKAHRRPGRPRLVAPRPVSRLRGRRRLLGAGRDGAYAGTDHGGRARGERAPRNSPQPSRSRSRTTASANGSSPSCATCSASASAHRSNGPICSPPGGSSSSG